MDNPVIQATLGTRHTTEKSKGANPEWTIRWYRQHWVQDTQQRKAKGQTQNGQSGDTGNIGYKTHNREKQRGKPRMDNLVIQATLGTRHTTEKSKGANPEWTIRWYRQHWVQDTQQRKPKGQTQNGQSGDTGNIGYKTHNRENQRGKHRMDNLVIQATLGTRHTTEKSKGANPEWTIWWYRQHWVQDTQQRKAKGQTQNGQSGDTGNIGYKTHNREKQRGKPRMDNPMIQVTLGTRHTAEKTKGANPEWTIWWYRQHWVQDTQQRKTNKNTSHKTKKVSNTGPSKIKQKQKQKQPKKNEEEKKYMILNSNVCIIKSPIISIKIGIYSNFVNSTYSILKVWIFLLLLSILSYNATTTHVPHHSR